MAEDTIVAHIGGDWLCDSLQEQLADWPGVKPGDIDAAIREAETSRDRLLSLIVQIDDPEDQSMTLAVHYIELRTQWIALNTRINYTVFRTGSPRTEDALLGTALSVLLTRLESLITPDDIDHINEFLARPVKAA